MSIFKKLFTTNRTDNSADITGFFTSLFVGEEQVLFIGLFSDGTINRMGTGSLEKLEKDMFIGKTSPDVFEALKKMISSDLLKWFNNQYSDSAAKGLPCKLTLGFKQRDGKELISIWQYGSESASPPPEVFEFFLKSIEITYPWYEERKRATKS
jgi:hypothetical protein